MSVFSYNDLSYELIDNSYINIVPGSNPTGILTIPAEISHLGTVYPVQNINQNAFINNSNITYLDCSNSNIITIYENAFRGCSNLTSINFLNCVSLTTIKNSAFRDCTSLLSIDLSSCTNLTTILNDSFRNCSSIEYIDLTNCNKITNIRYSVFRNNTNLTDVKLTNCSGLISIENDVFRDCPNLINIDFTGCTSLEEIIWSTFRDCSTLETINLIDCLNLNLKGNDVFNGCTSLKNIYFGCQDPPTVGNNTFLNIDVSAVVYAYENSNFLPFFDVTGANIPVRYMSRFTGYYNDLSYELIDNSYINIVGGNPTGILTIPSTIIHNTKIYPVNEISTNSFLNNSAITSLNASSSNLKYIRNSAFYNAYNIATIDLSGSNDLIEIENNAFQAVFNVRSINFTGCYSLTTIGSSSLGNGNSNPNNHNKGLTSLDFTDCYKLSSIGDNVFQNDVSLNSITFGSLNPPTIGVSIFDNIDPNAVVYVNWWSNFGTTFGTNPSLPVVKLYNDITYQNNNDIFVNIILYDSNLEFALGNENILNGTLILPNYINDIPLRNLKPFTSTSLGTGVGFVNLIRHVNFQNLTNLSQILFGCFQYCTNIISVNFSGCSGLTTIDEYTFNGCTNLTSVDLSGCTSLATIGSNAFKNCTNLVDLDLNVCTSLTSIGENAFENCTSLEDIDITNLTNLSTFNDSLFKNSGIKSIIIPASLTQHGDPTFENCHNLKKITYLGPCPPDLNTIGLSLSTTPYKGLPADAKIYIYYKYSITNPENNGPGPYFKTEYVRGSTIPVIIIDPPESTKHCCPSKPILDKSHSTYKEGQNASKIFTRINESRYSRVKRRIHISQSNFTNICDPRIKINIDINTDIQNNQSHLDNINRLNNSINCTNRKRFGAFLAGLKNA